MTVRLSRILAAALLGMAASTVALAGPAVAAACPKGTGVTVVVGSNVRCDGNGGGPASNNFGDTGHTLTYVQRQPGFVCQVDGAPTTSCVNTPPADAYWGLFWSNGTSGTWTYASSGVGSLTVPAGGWVAFVFQTGSSKTYPGVKPVAATAPKPAPVATTPPRTAGSSTTGSTPTATPTTAAQKTAAQKAAVKKAAEKKAAKRKTQAVKPSPSASATADGPVSDDQVEEASTEAGRSGTLGWVAGAIAAVLLGGMGGMIWRRKSAGGHGS